MGLENCSDYVYVTEFDSSQLKLSNYDIAYQQITNEHIPDICYSDNNSGSSGGNKNSKKTGIIISVVVAVVVAIIIIVVVVVVIVIKKRKSDKSSQEGKTETTNAEQA